MVARLAGEPHRTLRKGLAVSNSLLNGCYKLIRERRAGLRPADAPTDFGTHRASKFAAAITAGPAAGEPSAAGRMMSETSSAGHAPP